MGRAKFTSVFGCHLSLICWQIFKKFLLRTGESGAINSYKGIGIYGQIFVSHLGHVLIADELLQVL